MRRLAIPLLCAAALAASASPAAAAATRVEYVTQADAVCRSYDPEAAALARGFKQRVRQNKKEQAARGVSAEDALTVDPSPFAWYLGRTNKRLERMTAQLAALTPAPGDEAAVGLWLQGRRDYQALARPAVRNFKRRKTKRAILMYTAAVATAFEADKNVNGWGFHDCVVEVKSYAQASGS